MAIFRKIKKRSEEVERFQKGFERRYIRPAVHKEDERIGKSLSKLISQNLEVMQKVPDRAEAMSYYDEMVTSDTRVREIQNFKGKVIGTFCNFVPEELIYAAGAIPIRLCAGFYDTIHPAEEVLPRDICPLIKSSLGFKILGLPYFELCDVVILPTSCDGKKKLGEILNDYLPVWMPELPQNKDLLSSRNLWLGEIKVLKERLEQFCRIKITKERLKVAIRLLHKRGEVFRRLYEIRKYKPCPINERDALLVTQASFYDDINRWIKNTEKLVERLCSQPALAKRSGQGKLVTSNQKPRLLLTGAPIIWPNYKVLNIVEEAGAVIVMDELCSGTQHLYDPVEVDEWTLEGMLEAIANRYLLPSTCPCFTESNDRIDKLLEMVEDFSCEGVIYHSLRLCQLYDIEEALVKQVLKDKGIPMLNIHTDYSGEDIEQLKTRVEAFLEMIKSRI